MAQLKHSVYATPSNLAVSGDLPPGEGRRTAMKQGQAELAGPPQAAGAPQAIELRHLRYFAAVADAGSFTHAAEKMFIAQPTLSQQIRRLEEIVGASLLQRRREGLRLTPAGAVLLDASRTVLSLVDHEMNRTRQAAGLGRPRLRVVVPPGLPDALAVEAASALRSAAAAADVEIAWLEAPLDGEFSLIRQRRADAGVGWLTDPAAALPEPLEVMSLGDFEPAVIAGTHPGLIRLPRAMISQDMVLACLEHHPLTATAAVVWSGDLPRPLQQVLFDAADGITPSAAAQMGEREPAATGLCPQVA